MKKNYITPKVKCMIVNDDALMLPDSVSGGDVTPPTVNNVANGITNDNGTEIGIPAATQLPNTYNAWEDEL